MSQKNAMPCVLSPTGFKGSFTFFLSVLEQIPLNSQNSAEFAVLLYWITYLYFQICALSYLKKHKNVTKKSTLNYAPKVAFC